MIATQTKGHMIAKHWKGLAGESDPWFIKQVMKNNLRTPLAFFVIGSLHGIPFFIVRFVLGFDGIFVLFGLYVSAISRLPHSAVVWHIIFDTFTQWEIAQTLTNKRQRCVCCQSVLGSKKR